MPFLAFMICAGLPQVPLSNPSQDAGGGEKANLIRIVSTGADFVLEEEMEPNKATLFVFYQETSSADRAVVEDVKTRVNRTKTIGLRLAKLKNLDAPAAQTYEIHETPTLMLLDRFGKLMIRTSRVEDIGPVIERAVRMARIKWVDEDDPEAPKTYGFPADRRRPVAGILKTMSLRPELLNGINRVAGMAHFSNGFLPRRTKEMIATYVSAVNHCKF